MRKSIHREPGNLFPGLLLNFRVFEDAVLHEAACHAGIESIVTRNTVDFKQSTLPVFAPADFVAAMPVLKSN